MMSDIPANVYHRESQQLIRRLSLAKGFVQDSGEIWSVFSRNNNFRRPIATVEAWPIEAMRERGHLVVRPGGGLLPLSVQQEMSGKLSDHRPLRPEDEAHRP